MPSHIGAEIADPRSVGETCGTGSHIAWPSDRIGRYLEYGECESSWTQVAGSDVGRAGECA